MLLILLIFLLVIITSLIKNSSKKIEDQVFSINENIRLLNNQLGDVLLEYNYLSSPKKLHQYQYKYFENNLIQMDISNIKKIFKNNDQIIIKNFINIQNNDE